MLNGRLSVLALLCTVAPAAALGADKKTVKIYLMAGQSNIEGHNYFGPICNERFPGLDTPRDDVWCVRPGNKISGPLRPGFGGGPGADNVFGPELVMGRILGDAVENPIIMYKSALGGTQLHTRGARPVQSNGPAARWATCTSA